MAHSMELINDLADGIIIGVVIAMVLILALIVLLFLHAKKVEIGIYLALGERKKIITTQLLLEIIYPVIICFSMSLLLGTVLSQEVSGYMLSENMAELSNGFSTTDAYEIRGLRIEMSHEEMLEMFEIRIDVTTVMKFYLIVIGTTSIAIIIPMIMVFKMSPKDILHS